jgi:asparaginyl-tRNA synthetase
MRPALALRPSAVSRYVPCPRRVCHRCLSQQPNRSIAELLRWKPAQRVDHVVVNGFVRSVRSMKAHNFVSLGDGSSISPLQALVQTDQADGCEQPPSRPLTAASAQPSLATNTLSTVLLLVRPSVSPAHGCLRQGPRRAMSCM